MVMGFWVEDVGSREGAREGGGQVYMPTHRLSWLAAPASPLKYLAVKDKPGSPRDCRSGFTLAPFSVEILLKSTLLLEIKY